MPTFSVSGVIGTNFTDTSSTAQVTTGTKVLLSDGGEAMYVQASEAISTYGAVTITASQTAALLTTTNSATSKRVGFAQVSIASGYYGWVQLSGVMQVNLAANCDDNVPLYTTATGGVLDDATISGCLVIGCTSTRTISNATAVTCIAAGIAVIGTGAMPG